MSQYIFLDESGDLGFNPKKKNSKFFIISIIFASEKKPLEKIVKRTHGDLRKKVKKLSGGVLHAYKEKPVTRIKLLQRLTKCKCSIMVIYLNKSKVYTHLQNEKHILYNYVVNILLDRIMTKKLVDIRSTIFFIAAKRETNKFLNLNFQQYLKSQIENKHNLSMKIELKTPNEEKALQVVDFASWALFRKYESGDNTYYKIIQEVIKEESGLFS